MNKATQPEAYVEHDGGSFSPVEVRVVATWPVGSFAENLAVHPDGSVFVSLHTPQRIDRYDPISGRTTPFTDLPAPGMGLAFDAAGTLWATGGALPQGPGYVWRVGTGRHRSTLDRPAGRALHQWLHHSPGRENAARLRKHDGPDPCDRYARTPPLERVAHRRNPDPRRARNPGRQRHQDHDWHAWISVSGRRLILRTRIESDGTPGPLQTVGTRIMADDFAIAVSGALYIATHPAQSVVRLDTSGTRITVAGPNQGAVGSTACAFGRTPADDMAIL
jgi:sugar lactone lactonase YvrE